MRQSRRHPLASRLLRGGGPMRRRRRRKERGQAEKGLACLLRVLRPLSASSAQTLISEERSKGTKGSHSVRHRGGGGSSSSSSSGPRRSYSDMVNQPPPSPERQEKLRLQRERVSLFYECFNANTVSRPPLVQEMLPLKDYLTFKRTNMLCYVSIGHHKCVKLTQAEDMGVGLKENDDVMILNASDSHRDNLLRSLINLTHLLCGSSIGLIPYDLKHLLRYSSKVQRVRKNDEFILQHPALWNEISVEKMLLSLDINNSITTESKPLNKVVARISFSWKKDFENLVINNVVLNQRGFYVTIRKIWTNTKFCLKCGDEIGGFIHLMGNIFTHLYDELNGASKLMAKSHQAKAIWEFMHAFKPDFLCLSTQASSTFPNFDDISFH
ncbi:hypothetical protein DM860_001157 [Cuscuta australis]|uniref:Uncharacterized protein n=1 Tax=Cuscuta australis TaxID=267555 RepID=A0A328DSY6_9ASTE|nr:hypothetical protein DM860_001157 [Cuscuta australis]